jgi:opacity protein-like surface antigen
LFSRLITFFLFLVVLSFDAASSIKQIIMRPQESGTLLSVVMDKPIALKSIAESDEVFVIDGFSFNDWGIEKQGPGQGDIKEYYIEDYSNGGGELVVRTKPGFHITSANMVPKGSYYHYEVLLEGGDASIPLGANARKEIAIAHKVQVGQSGEATRLVIYLNRSVNLSFSTNPNGTETLIIPEERLRWEAQTTMESASGLFRGYELLDQSNRMVIKVKTMPGTKVGKSYMQDASGANPKYVIDLMPDTISPVSNNLFDAASNPSQQLGMNGMPGLAGGFPAPMIQDSGLIQSMDILTQNDDTVIKFVTKEPLNIDVTENEYTNQVIVHLPKVNWMNVNALDKNGGLIDGYMVDQSSFDGTNLVLSVKKGTHVIGKKTVSGGAHQSHRFIIHLNQNEHKLPEWLVDATTEALVAEENPREEIETTPMLYRGGVSATASIGQGLYAGWNFNFFGSEDKEESSNGRGATHKFYSGITGGGFDGYLGFGAGLSSSLYLGGEAMVGYYLDKQTRSFQNGPLYESVSNIGLTWGGSVRVGGYVSPMALLYARLGAVSTDFYFKGTTTSTGEVVFPGNYARRNRTGFLYGVGLDAAYNDYTSIRFELSQVNYQPFRYGDGLAAIKHRFILNQFSLGMTHHFRALSGPAAALAYDESVVRGIYGGVLFALNTMYSKRNFTNTTGGAKINYYGGDSSTDPVWGFYLGYGRAKGRFYYAAEADVSLSESVTSEKVTFSAGDYESFEDSLKWRWGAVGRLGYIVNHGVVAYGKLGFASAKFGRSFDNSGTGVTTPQLAVPRKINKYLFGVRSGGGLEITVSRVLGIRGDWTIDYYPKFQIKGTTLPLAKEKQTIIDNRFGLGLTIYINDALASMGLGTAV